MYLFYYLSKEQNPYIYLLYLLSKYILTLMLINIC